MAATPLSAEAVRVISHTAKYRKTVLTEISEATFPPGTVYATPEGLRAEDEPTRAAFDVQGGVYPIRESVFRASYERATLDAERAKGARGMDVEQLLAAHTPWARTVLAELRVWMACSCGWNIHGDEAETWNRHFLRAALAGPAEPVTPGFVGQGGEAE